MTGLFAFRSWAVLGVAVGLVSNTLLMAQEQGGGRGGGAEGVRTTTAEDNDGGIDDGGTCIAAGHGPTYNIDRSIGQYYIATPIGKVLIQECRAARKRA